MKGVNTVLDRLTRKRASNAADFTVTCVAVQEMRLCLLERVVAKVQVQFLSILWFLVRVSYTMKGRSAFLQ